jgi:cobaltochelatase CobS
LRESIDAILRKLGDYVTLAEHGKAVDNLAFMLRQQVLSTTAKIEALTARLGDLEKTRPVEFHLGQGPSFPPVDFGGELIHEKLPTLLRVLLAGEQAYLAGPAGSGKTTAAKQARKVLAAAFGRGEDYQCLAMGAVDNAYALIGYKDITREYARTLFREAYEHGHLFLWDEVDGSAADAQLVINSLDNGFIAFPDKVVTAHPHFRIICGGNTKGAGATLSYSGRHALDGAFLDRFSMIEWNLDPRIETRLSRGLSSWLDAVRAIRAYAEKREILDALATARAVRRGPAFLEQGMSRMTVLETTCKRGALDSCWPEILRLPAVNAFLQGA